MDRFIDLIGEGHNLRLAILSFLLFGLSYLLKFIVIKKVEKNSELMGLEKTKVRRSVRSYINLLLIISLLIIWFSQIQAILVSFIAIAAAIVLATKELIMNFTGGLLIRSNSYFRLGDRIEVDGIRGFVIEKNITVTKVLEIGPEKTSQQTTGDIISIPNSMMLTKSVKNESYFKGYSIKSFNLRLPEHTDFQTFEKLVLSWANEICSGYLEEARSLIGSFCRKEGLLIPTVEPRAKIIMKEDGGIEILLKIPVNNQEIGDIEQKLFRHYVNYLNSKRHVEI